MKQTVSLTGQPAAGDNDNTNPHTDQSTHRSIHTQTNPHTDSQTENHIHPLRQRATFINRQIYATGSKSKLQALIYDILPPTTAVTGYGIGFH